MGDSATFPGTSIVDMTGWTHQLQSFTDSHNNPVACVPTFTVIGPLQVNLTFASGFTESLPAGDYFFVWKRIDLNNMATLAKFKWVIKDDTKPALTG
jgi:hypothetical protein